MKYILDSRAKDLAAMGVTSWNLRTGKLFVLRSAFGGAPFTEREAVAVLRGAEAMGLAFRSGSPKSSVRAFIKNGYFAPLKGQV